MYFVSAGAPAPWHVSPHAILLIPFEKYLAQFFKAPHSIEISCGPGIMISGLPLYSLIIPVTQIFLLS